MKATGWSYDEATRWVDAQHIQPLGELIDGLPDSLAERSTASLRAHNTWRMRVRHGDEVRFVFLAG